MGYRGYAVLRLARDSRHELKPVKLTLFREFGCDRPFPQKIANHPLKRT